ncbi:MAG: ATP-binding protein [Clostridium sp.]|nr:ATP-binding protein [Clostridium sp.]
MKIYWCIPELLFNTKNADEHKKDCNILENDIRKYYGQVEVEIVGQKNQDKIEIYVMGKPRYEGFQEEIQKSIITAVIKCYGESAKQRIQIKLNYAAFNPNFVPKSDCSLNQQENLSSIQKKEVETREKDSEYDYEKLSNNYQAVEPKFSFDQVILPQKTLNQVEEAIGVLEVEAKVFDEWGLRAIIPEATSALSFYGPPGTGKTMTAEAIAHKLGKKILRATYADVESKFHGEGPKMVKAIFRAAERDDAVLFLDESDSLLSKRLTNVSDGSAQAINSMRSQLLISLESFKGIVIFATNLVVNYDRAFLSRLINVEFTNPTAAERKKIWWNHLKTDKIHIPLAADVDINCLAESYELCGREIKNVVKNACVSAALKKQEIVEQEDFIIACEKAIDERTRVNSAKDQTKIGDDTASEEKKEKLKDAIQKKIDAGTIDIVKSNAIE